MYIFQALYHAFSGPSSSSSNTTNTSNTHQQTDDESSPLLLRRQSQPSLTDEFVEFSHSWTALRIFCIHALVYYTLAGVGFYFIEQLSVVDSLYFATVMFTTVGYGEIAAVTVPGQCFTMALGGYGIGILGVFVGIAGEHLLEHRQEAREARKKQFKKTAMQTAIDQSSRCSTRLDATTTSSDQQHDEPEAHCESQPPPQQQKTVCQEIREMIWLELPGVVLILVIAIVIGSVEGWTVFESIYWAAITGSTIGLGDYFPSKDSTRLACVLFLPLCVAIVGEILARIAALYMDRQNDLAEQEFCQRTLTMCDLQRLDMDQSGTVDKAEFLIYMLKAFAKVDQDDIDPIMELFDRLDVTKNGHLDRHDIELINQNIQQSIRQHRPSSRLSNSWLPTSRTSSSATRGGELLGSDAILQQHPSTIQEEE